MMERRTKGKSWFRNRAVAHAKDAQPDPHEAERWKQHMHQDGLWCGDVNCKTCAKSGAMAKGVKEMKRAKDAEVQPVGDAACPLCKYPMSGSKCDNPGCAASGNVPSVIIERRKKEAAEQAERARISKLRNASYAKDAEVQPVKYSTEAVQKEINKDKRIGGKEAKAIHALLKGRDDAFTPISLKPGDKVHLGLGAKLGAGFTGTLEKIEGEVAYVKSDEKSQLHGRELPPRTYKGPVKFLSRATDATDPKQKPVNVAPIPKVIPRSKRPKVEDTNPFEVDTDAGAERIVRREAKAGLTAAQIARKHGFSLSFVKEVLDDVKPVGDAVMKAAQDPSTKTPAFRLYRELAKKFDAVRNKRDAKGVWPESTNRLWKELESARANWERQSGRHYRPESDETF